MPAPVTPAASIRVLLQLDRVPAGNPLLPDLFRGGFLFGLIGIGFFAGRGLVGNNHSLQCCLTVLGAIPVVIVLNLLVGRMCVLFGIMTFQSFSQYLIGYKLHDLLNVGIVFKVQRPRRVGIDQTAWRSYWQMSASSPAACLVVVHWSVFRTGRA